jgi:hypothetical protein
MNSILLQAIQQSTTVELRYHNYSRIVEPHAYGRDKDADEILRCYQTSGGSESGERVGWKLLKVREAFSIHTTGTSFSTRPEYKRNDKAMNHIFAQI